MRTIANQTVDCARTNLSWNPRNMRLARVLAGILLLAWFCNPANVSSAPAAPSYSVTLAWDSSPSPGVAGYRIYYGAVSGNYTSSVTVGNATTNTISNLVSGATYFITTTAYDAAGVESPFSNEVAYTVPGGMANLKITMAANKQAVLAVTGQSGHTYQIQASTNLSSWSVVGTVTLGMSGTANFTDTNAPSYSARYYRTSDTTP